MQNNNFDDTYDYIKKFYADKFEKRHLFLMIQPSPEILTVLREKLLSYIDLGATPNFLRLQGENLKVEIYLPYSHSDFFVKSQDTGKDQTIIKNIQQTIQKWPNKLFYQRDLMTAVATTYFDAFTTGAIGQDVYLAFCDLIKHTALNPTKPLAFQAIGMDMKQITDMSGSMEQIYKRIFNDTLA